MKEQTGKKIFKGLQRPSLEDEQERSALEAKVSQKEAHIRNLENNVKTKQNEYDRLISQEKIYKNTITTKENGIKVLSNSNRILQTRLAELEHIGMLHQQENNRMRQHISTLELKQQQIDDLQKQNDELVKRSKTESEKYKLLQNKKTEIRGKDTAIINKMYSDLTKAQSLLSQQLKEKESEYNKLIATMDDKFTAFVDEKQKLDETLQLNEDREDDTTQVADRETLKMQNKEDWDGATSLVTQVKESFPHHYKEFLEILISYEENIIWPKEMILRM